MKYLFILCTALLMASVAPISDAQTKPAKNLSVNPNNNTISGRITEVCKGKSTSCIENETLCLAGDAAACAARKREDAEFEKKKGKKKQ